MFKIPLVVAQIDERRRRGDFHVLQLTLVEDNEDGRLNLSEISLSIKIRPEDDNDPQNGFNRKRFNPGDIWYLVKEEGHQEKTSKPEENE